MNTPTEPRLDALLTELRRTKRVRRQRGLAAVTGALAIALLVPTVMLIYAPATPPAPTGGQIVTAPEKTDPIPTEFAHQDEPVTIPEPALRLITVSTQRTASSVLMIDDEQELIKILRETGRPTGIIRTHGRSFVDAEWLTKADEYEEQSESSPTPLSPTV